jgi:hypothetical protein
MPGKKKSGAKAPAKRAVRNAAPKKAVAKKTGAKRSAERTAKLPVERSADRALASLKKALRGHVLPGPVLAANFTASPHALTEGDFCDAGGGRPGRLVLVQTGNGSVFVCVPI